MGALGGLLVGITSVGSGSVIMIALLMLYPGLSAVRLVGTDLVQAVPLVLAAAISNIALHGLDWAIFIPLIVGSVPGHRPRRPDRAAGARSPIIRRGIVVVLTMSGVALLDKAGWAPLGAGEHDTHPMLIGRRRAGDAGARARWSGASCAVRPDCRSSARPTLAEVEDPSYRPGGWRAARAPVPLRGRLDSGLADRASRDQRVPNSWAAPARDPPAAPAPAEDLDVGSCAYARSREALLSNCLEEHRASTTASSHCVAGIALTIPVGRR